MLYKTTARSLLYIFFLHTNSLLQQQLKFPVRKIQNKIWATHSTKTDPKKAEACLIIQIYQLKLEKRVRI